MTDLISPTVHLNGTSREALLDQYTAIDIAFVKLQAVLALAQPNGRDYYPQGDNATSLARAAFTERLQTISLLRREFEGVAFDIAGVTR